jgi:hypothetical protein
MNTRLKPMTLHFKKIDDTFWIREITNDEGAVLWTSNQEIAASDQQILVDWANQMVKLPFFNIVSIKSDYFNLTDLDFEECLLQT